MIQLDRSYNATFDDDPFDLKSEHGQDQAIRAGLELTPADRERRVTKVIRMHSATLAC